MAKDNRDIRELLYKLTSGRISQEEKILLEQLAREDPFIQDAVEGYKKVKTNQSENLTELRKLIQTKSYKTKSPVLNFSWRVAASLLLLIGTASIIYFMGQYKDKGASDQMAVSLQSEKQETKLYEQERDPNVDALSQPQPAQAEEIISDRVAPVGANKSTKKPARDTEREQTNLPRSNMVSSDQSLVDSPLDGEYNSVALLEGRVFDDIGNPLIGASIHLSSKDSTIYTDIDGRFVLALNDSSDHLNISYAGFESTEIEKIEEERLKSIVLKEDQTALDEVVVLNVGKSENKMTKRRSRTDKVVSEALSNEAHPVNGWARYYAYIEQNRRIPKVAKKAKVTGSVELQFSIDQNGRPQNILVQKSLGYGCDQEAIRLVQEGPAWTISDQPKPQPIDLSIRF